jgi:glycosyltransferase involved in cell wall biosynthesis
MKIAMLIDTYLPIIGGAEIHVTELSRALRNFGHEVKICTAVSSFTGEVEEEFPVIRFPMLNGGGRRAFVNIPRAIPGLIKCIKQVDFVHCHYSFLMAALGTILARILGKRSAVTLHGLGTLDSSVGKNLLWKFYRFVSLKWAHTIIATSEEMKDVASRFAPNRKIVIIPNGVNTNIFKPKKTVNESISVVLTMRRLAPKNGVQYLVEAIPAVIAKCPQTKFLIAGEGKLEDYIRKRVAELNVEEYCEFIGIVPHAKTPDYYQKADVVVFPSSAESTSLACLEAMSCEKAVIASNLKAYQDMLGTNGERGLLVRLFDRETSDYNAPLALPEGVIVHFSEMIINLLKDKPLQESLGKNAREYVVKYFDWTKIAKDIIRVYEESHF